MKYIIVYGISLMFILNLHAQSNISTDSAFSLLQNNRYFLNHTNTLQQKNNLKFPNIYFEKVKPADFFVLQSPKPKLFFVNNINHSNIYQSSPDNMFIIKPDSTILLICRLLILIKIFNNEFFLLT